MATPKHGIDADADDKIRKLTNVINNTVTVKILKGCEGKILKDFIRALGKAKTEAEFIFPEKLQQSTGGVKSTSRKRDKNQQQRLPLQ